MKQTYIFMLSVLLLGVGCTEKKINSSDTPYDGFILKGIAKGIADSTMLYIEDADNSTLNKPMDSAMVVGGKFELKGKIDEPAMRIILKTKDFSNYRFIWVENKEMLFEGENKKFRQAIVSGSDTELVDSRLNALIMPVRKSQDSINDKLQDNTLEKSEKARLKRQLQELYKEEEERYMGFVHDNPNTIVSAHILEVYSSTWGREKTDELFSSFSDENKASKYGKAISNYLRLNKNPKIGELFADFSQQTADGNIVRLSDLKDKVILLEFWASWCGPCRFENPNLVNTYQNYKDKGFEVFAVSLDVNKNHWLKAIEKDELPWIQVSELNGNKNSAALIYGINGIPDNFLIAKDGTIVGRNLRGEKLNERLAELLD